MMMPMGSAMVTMMFRGVQQYMPQMAVTGMGLGMQRVGISVEVEGFPTISVLAIVYSTLSRYSLLLALNICFILCFSFVYLEINCDRYNGCIYHVLVSLQF